MLGTIVINGFNINLNSSSLILCKIFYYVSIFSSALSSTILVLASIDRLLISSQNVQTRLYSSKRLAYFSISISTVFWFIFYFHVLIKFDIKQVDPSIYVCLYDLNGFYDAFFTYSMLIINLMLFVIMIILSILSYKNVRQIRLVPLREQRQNIRTMHKKDFQLLRCLFLKDIIYIICNSLLCIHIIYRAVTKYQIQTTWGPELDNFIFNVGTLIHHIPLCISFFVFVIVSKSFRQGLKRLIWKIIGKNLPPVREEEQEAREDNNELNVVNAVVLTT